MRLLYGRDTEVCSFVQSTMPWVSQSFEGCHAVGVVNSDNALIGGVVYSGYDGKNVFISCGGIGDWLKKDDMGGFFLFAFSAIGAQKVSCICRKSDIIVRNLCRSLGFKKEGIIRQFFSTTGEDAVYYGLFLNELKLKGVK